MNINDSVRVVLTDLGRDLLHRWAVEQGTPVLNIFPNAIQITENQHKDGRFSLWELMAVFGPHMYVGAPQYFKDNQVITES